MDDIEIYKKYASTINNETKKGYYIFFDDQKYKFQFM